MKFDMKQLMKQAQTMQAEMERRQKALAEQQFTATSGGGMVTATINGKHEVVALKIDPSIITRDDPEMLEDLVIAAVNEGVRQASEAAQSDMQGMLGGMGGLGNMFS